MGNVYRVPVVVFIGGTAGCGPLLNIIPVTAIKLMILFPDAKSHTLSNLSSLCSQLTAEYSDSGHCRPCHSTCETCTGSTEGDCLSCSSSFLLQHNKCVTSCDEGYYMETGGCAKCLHTCTQCVSRMNCTQCAKGLLLQSGECRTTCADG